MPRFVPTVTEKPAIPRLAGLLGGAALLLASIDAGASLVGATPGYPDLKADGLTVLYSGADELLIGYSGAPQSWDYVSEYGQSSVNVQADYMLLTVNFASGSPGDFESGTIEVKNGTDTLVTGSLVDFGYEFVDGASFGTAFFDAFFDISSGSTLDFEAGTTGSFTGFFDDIQPATFTTLANGWADSAFNNSGRDGGIVDITGPALPLPPTLLLLTPALLGGLWVRRRRS